MEESNKRCLRLCEKIEEVEATQNQELLHAETVNMMSKY